MTRIRCAIVVALVLSFPDAAAAGERLKVEWSAAWDQARSPTVHIFEEGLDDTGYHEGSCTAQPCRTPQGFRWEGTNPNAAGDFKVIALVEDAAPLGRPFCFEVRHAYAGSPFPIPVQVTVTTTAPNGSTRTAQRTLDVGQRMPRECSPVEAAVSAPPDPGPQPWFDDAVREVQSRGGRCTETSEAVQPVLETPYTLRYRECVRAVPKESGLVREGCTSSVSQGDQRGDAWSYGCDVLAAPGTERRPNPATWVCQRYHLWEHGDTVRRRPNWYATATKIFPAGAWRTLAGCLTPRAAGTARSQGVQTAGRRGFTVPVACSVACTVELQVVRGKAVLARGARRLPANRRATVRARFSPTGKRALQGAQRLTVRLVARAGRRRGRAEDTVHISGSRISAPTLDVLLRR